MKNRIFFQIVGLVMVIALLAACTPAASTPTPAEPEEVIELVYWYTLSGRAAEAQVELVDKFNQSQDRIRVTTELQGNYTELSTKILSDFGAGGGPDVSQLGTFEIAQFGSSGVLVNLKPFMEGQNGIDTSTWSGTMVQAGQIGDATYWLPFNVSVPVLYYNKDAFEEAGLPGPPETLQQFYDYARQLSIPGERVGVALWNITWPFQSIVWSQGGEFNSRDYSSITLNDPVVVDVFTQFRQLIIDGAASMPDPAAGGHRTAFLNGQAAMILDSPAPFGDIFANAEGFTPAVANYPAGDAGKVYAPGGGGIVMIANTPEEKQAAAWEFMKFMLSAESIAYYANETGYAAFYPGAMDAAAQMLDDERYATLNAAAAHLRGDFSINFSPAVRTNLDNALARIFTNLNEDVQTILDEADAQAEIDIQNEDFGS